MLEVPLVLDAVNAVAAYLRPFGSVESVANLARQLPAGLASCVGFECRLGERPAAIDLPIEINSSPAGRSALTRLAMRTDLDSHVQQRPISKQLRDFCAEWNDRTSPLHDAGLVWLEFDVPAGEQYPRPVPGLLFVEFSPTEEPWSATTGLPTRIMLGRLVERMVRVVKGSSVPPILSMLVESDGAGFAGMRPCVLGLPIARPGDSVRVCLRVPPDHIRDGLEASGWRLTSSARRHFDSLLATVGPVCGRIVVDVDIGRDLSPAIGLEVGFPRRVGPLVHAGWPDLLTCIVALGLCTADKRDALLAFPGEPSLTAAADTARVRRQINHIKLTVVDGQAIEAKAYLAATFVGAPAPARTAPL